MGSIDVIDFKKSFDGKTIHNGVSFSVKPGQCMGLLGGSGTGKSVLLRSLIGLESADSGEIKVFGKEVTTADEEALTEIRKEVAYVFQDGALFDSMTVFENVAYPLEEHSQLSQSEIKEKVESLLDDFGLLDAKNLLKAELSGGMQKRVGLARSIILGPKVVLYDEPTAGLDPRNTLKIQQLILKLKKRGITAILVTHDMPTALAVCDEICLLHKGVIQACCPADELIHNSKHPIYQFIQGTEE